MQNLGENLNATIVIIQSPLDTSDNCRATFTLSYGIVRLSSIMEDK